MGGKDNDGRFHGYPTGNRHATVWAHEKAKMIPQLDFRQPGGRSAKQQSPVNEGIPPKADPFTTR